MVVVWSGNTLLHLGFRVREGGGVVRKQPLHLTFCTREGVVWLKNTPLRLAFRAREKVVRWC